jgi:hypothetical protein
MSNVTRAFSDSDFSPIAFFDAFLVFSSLPAVSSRLMYPRLASCDVGYFAGPPCAAASPVQSVQLLSEHHITVSPSASPASFQLEERVLRTLASIQTQWEKDAVDRTARVKARAEAVEARASADALAAAQAETLRQEALAEKRRLEAEKAAADEAARRMREAEEARLADAEAKLRERESALAAEKAALQKLRGGLPVAFPVAKPAEAAPASGVGSGVAQSYLTPEQHAASGKFMELTGVNDVPKVALLLSLLHYDLDRAIGLFFATNPPSLEEALVRAQSIQRNALQQQQAAHHAAASQPQQVSPQHAIQSAYPVMGAVSHVSPAVSSSWQGNSVKVLLPDGSPQVVSCVPSDTLWTLYEKVSASLQSRPTWANKPIRFVPTAFPSPPFGEDRFDSTLTAVFAGAPQAEATLRIELSR